MRDFGEMLDDIRCGVPNELADEVHVCTRPEPHVCQVNGPCNGWPKPGSSHGDYQGPCPRCGKPIYELSGDPYAHVGCRK